eukprot:TRINITY_DN13682_c0_g1_i17.p1 TRINITY_DN13682_c0_g1~~TRINITY_DN13682_c0_g1_i17.p1  ORF type:complete len:176 (-),score=17.67 TRINITY_DN13682_c0_g1_i17:146-673(-)
MGVCGSTKVEERPKTTSPKPAPRTSTEHARKPAATVETSVSSTTPKSTDSTSAVDGGSGTIKIESTKSSTAPAPSADYQPRDDEATFSLSVKYPKEDEIEELTLNNVYGGMHVSQLKNFIYKQPKIKDITARLPSFDPVTSVMLIHNTRPMDDAEKLESYGIDGNGESVTYILST